MYSESKYIELKGTFFFLCSDILVGLTSNPKPFVGTLSLINIQCCLFNCWPVFLCLVWVVGLFGWDGRIGCYVCESKLIQFNSIHTLFRVSLWLDLSSKFLVFQDRNSNFSHYYSSVSISFRNTLWEIPIFDESLKFNQNWRRKNRRHAGGNAWRCGRNFHS